MPFKVLTVNENGGDSRSMTAVQTQHSWTPGYSPGEDKLIVKIDTKKNIIIAFMRDNIAKEQIQFTGLDLDGLIEFLQDARTFISEEEMVEKLKGKN